MPKTECPMNRKCVVCSSLFLDASRHEGKISRVFFGAIESWSLGGLEFIPLLFAVVRASFLPALRAWPRKNRPNPGPDGPGYCLSALRA